MGRGDWSMRQDVGTKVIGSMEDGLVMVDSAMEMEIYTKEN